MFYVLATSSFAFCMSTMPFLCVSCSWFALFLPFMFYVAILLSFTFHSIVIAHFVLHATIIVPFAICISIMPFALHVIVIVPFEFVLISSPLCFMLLLLCLSHFALPFSNFFVLFLCPSFALHFLVVSMPFYVHNLYYPHFFTFYRSRCEVFSWQFYFIICKVSFFLSILFCFFGFNVFFVWFHVFVLSFLWLCFVQGLIFFCVFLCKFCNKTFCVLEPYFAHHSYLMMKSEWVFILIVNIFKFLH